MWLKEMNELAYRTRAENIAAVLFAALTIIGG
jgi:hypothetical protein